MGICFLIKLSILDFNSNGSILRLDGDETKVLNPTIGMTEIVIEAGGVDRNYWKDLWNYREVLYFLAWRDVAIRYKQTVAGFLWAFIRPFLTMVIMTVVFHGVAKLSSGTTPYALLVFAGVLPWMLFSSALTGGGGSLLGNAGLISKVYLPRLIIPTSTMAVCLFDFVISLFILAILMIWYQVAPTWKILTIPLWTILALLAAYGPAIWIGALNVKYRDFTQILPFLIQWGMFITPVGFSTTQAPAQWRTLYSLNPMVGVIDGFRWAICGTDFPIDWFSLSVSCFATIFLLIGGITYFRSVEKTFADVI